MCGRPSPDRLQDRRREAGDAEGGIDPRPGALPGRREDRRRVVGEVAGVERGLTAALEPTADDIDLAAVAGDGLLDGGAEARDRERARRRARELRAGAGVADQRLGDGGEAGVLAVVEIVGLGGGEEDAVDPPPEDRRQPRARPRAEAGEDLGHRRAQVLDGARALGEARRARPSAPPDGRGGRSGCGRRARRRRACRPRSAARRRATASPTARRSGLTSGEKVSAGEPSRSPGIRKRPGPTAAAAAREAAR